MKIIPIHQFNAEFLGGTGPKPMVYFNPDNSVSLLNSNDPVDVAVWQWTRDNGEQLRDRGDFFLNDETFGQIRDWLNQQEAAKKTLETPAPAVESVETPAPESKPECLFPPKDKEIFNESDLEKFALPEPAVEPSQLSARKKKQVEGIIKELDQKLTVAQLAKVVQKLAKAIK